METVLEVTPNVKVFVVRYRSEVQKNGLLPDFQPYTFTL